jgi:hypothetical protein
MKRYGRLLGNLVHAGRKNASIDWTVKESVRANMRAIVKRILRCRMDIPQISRSKLPSRSWHKRNYCARAGLPDLPTCGPNRGSFVRKRTQSRSSPFLIWLKDKEDSDPAKAEQYPNSRARLHEWGAYSALNAAINSGTHQYLSVAASRTKAQHLLPVILARSLSALLFGQSDAG